MRVRITCSQDHGGAIFDGKCEECKWAWRNSREYTDAEVIEMLRRLRDLEAHVYE